MSQKSLYRLLTRAAPKQSRDREGAVKELRRQQTSALKRGAGVLSILAMLAVAGLLYAHGGFDHVIGTVVKVEKNVLTVKTAKGNVDVRLDDKTEITSGGRKAGLVDLKPGTRIVVDVPEGAKEKIAHSVKVGVTESSSHAAPK